MVLDHNIRKGTNMKTERQILIRLRARKRGVSRPALPSSLQHFLALALLSHFVSSRPRIKLSAKVSCFNRLQGRIYSPRFPLLNAAWFYCLRVFETYICLFLISHFMDSVQLKTLIKQHQSNHQYWNSEFLRRKQIKSKTWTALRSSQATLKGLAVTVHLWSQ